MKLKQSMNIRRWGGVTTPEDTRFAQEHEDKPLIVEGFEFPRVHGFRELEPGEKIRFSFTFERPFNDTPGRWLYRAVKELSPMDGGWGDLTPDQRNQWEKIADVLKRGDL